jgi:hypothetical protein
MRRSSGVVLPVSRPGISSSRTIPLSTTEAVDGKAAIQSVNVAHEKNAEGKILIIIQIFIEVFDALQKALERLELLEAKVS